MPVELPEWRRSGRFLAIAALLHGALLAYPLQRALTGTEPLPRLAVTLVSPPPVAAPAPRPVAPEPVAKKEKPPQRSEPVAAPTRPILAMRADQPVTTAASVPAPVPASPTPAPETSAKPTAAPAAAPVTAARYNAAYLNNPEPKYPALSRRLGEEGKVLLKVRVTADGLAATVDVEKSSNFERLDEAARQAVGRWRFVPARRGEEAIEASVIVPIVFRLDN